MHIFINSTFLLIVRVCELSITMQIRERAIRGSDPGFVALYPIYLEAWKIRNRVHVKRESTPSLRYWALISRKAGLWLAKILAF